MSTEAKNERVEIPYKLIYNSINFKSMQNIDAQTVVKIARNGLDTHILSDPNLHNTLAGLARSINLEFNVVR